MLEQGGMNQRKQESEKREEVIREYEQLNTQINTLKNKGDIILTGDFNSKIQLDVIMASSKKNKSG